MNMNVYQPFDMNNLENPYTEDYFRQSARNKMSELQNAFLTAKQNAKSSTGTDFSEYDSYGTFDQHLAAALAQSGVTPDWASGMTELVRRESSFNPRAKNPKSTAYGYGQFLAATRANYEKKMGLDYDNPVHQLVMMMQYVKDRYGTPDQAIAFHDAKNWY